MWSYFLQWISDFTNPVIFTFIHLKSNLYFSFILALPPTIRPCALLTASDSFVLMLIISLSNCDIPLNIVDISLPYGVVVSIQLSLNNLIFAPFSSMISTNLNKSLVDLLILDKSHIIIWSSGLNWSNNFCSLGLSNFVPVIFSLKILSHPASLNCNICFLNLKTDNLREHNQTL